MTEGEAETRSIFIIVGFSLGFNDMSFEHLNAVCLFDVAVHFIARTRNTRDTHSNITALSLTVTMRHAEHTSVTPKIYNFSRPKLRSDMR